MPGTRKRLSRLGQGLSKRIRNTCRPHAPLVRELAQAGEHTAAVELSMHALQLNPHDDEIRFYQAASLMQIGHYAKAAQAAGHLINSGAAKAWPQAYQVMGLSYANLGKVEIGARYLRMFLERSPNATAAEAIRRQLDTWEQAGTIRAGGRSERRSTEYTLKGVKSDVQGAGRAGPSPPWASIAVPALEFLPACRDPVRWPATHCPPKTRLRNRRNDCCGPSRSHCLQPHYTASLTLPVLRLS